MPEKHLGFNSSFDINKVSFENVSEDFAYEFKKLYRNSLAKMSDTKDMISNTHGANALAVLEKMGHNMQHYSEDSDFKATYKEITREYEPFSDLYDE